MCSGRHGEFVFLVGIVDRGSNQKLDLKSVAVRVVMGEALKSRIGKR